MAGCNSCGGGKKIGVKSPVTKTQIINAIPENDRVKVKYLGGAYFHKIISPNAALFPYGFYNYGYGKYGDELIIHKNDLSVRQDARILFEPINEPIEQSIVDEPIIIEEIDEEFEAPTNPFAILE